MTGAPAASRRVGINRRTSTPPETSLLEVCGFQLPKVCSFRLPLTVAIDRSAIGDPQCLRGSGGARQDSNLSLGSRPPKIKRI